ncbi:hypothetical protein ON010_g14571 [Phytophthora cinnamomi]|nr:hypothetical protein ON010_g14571 [Phytophthora cinnamomi]
MGTCGRPYRGSVRCTDGGQACGDGQDRAEGKCERGGAAGADYEEESAGNEETDAPRAPPPPKKPKLAAGRSKAATRQVKATDAPRKTTEAPAPRRFGELKCYACNQLGHLDRECPDDEARTRNDEYLARRVQERKRQENEDRAT